MVRFQNKAEKGLFFGISIYNSGKEFGSLETDLTLVVPCISFHAVNTIRRHLDVCYTDHH